MTDQQYEFMTAIMDAYGQDDMRLNDWERVFINDMKIRFEKYGRTTYMSDKQWNAIKKIGNAYDLELDQF